MSVYTPTLHMMCGKMAAGKSTLATRLSQNPHHVLISEDRWLADLFGPEMKTPADYLHFAPRLRTVMAPHVTHLLAAGLSVVLDFPANTVETRVWMRGLVAQSGAAHQMHVLVASDAKCLARLRARNASGAHPFAPTEAQFHRFAKHYAPPTPDEGFSIVEHVVQPIE